MSHHLKRVWILIVGAALFLQAGPLSAQLMRGHWYQDPLYPKISRASATRAGIFPRHPHHGFLHHAHGGVSHHSQCQSACCKHQPSPESKTKSESATKNSATTKCCCAGGHKGRCLHEKPRHAALKLWVPDGLDVEINGKPTKRQYLAGTHRDSRIFSLTGLDDKPTTCQIVVWDETGREFVHELPVVAGGSHVSYYPRDFGPVPPNIRRRLSRVTDGLQVLYEFKEHGGKNINDRSDGSPLNLTIQGDPQVDWSMTRGLTIESKCLIKSDTPASELTKNVQQSKEITIEAWISTKNTSQSGPARIVTLSNGSSSRNFTLGQVGDKLEVRVRTLTSGSNGLGRQQISSSSRTVQKDKPLHVVYTRDKQGRAMLYVNGIKKSPPKKIEGDIGNWDDYHLALGDEFDYETPNRHWLGTYYLVAIYDRALSEGEVKRNLSSRF